MPGFATDVVWRPGGIIRQGISIDGIEVVIVAFSMADVDYVRSVTEAACEQYGTVLLTRAGHPPIHGDQPLTAPVVTPSGRLAGYVELAP